MYRETGAASKRQQEADNAEDVDLGTERCLALVEDWLKENQAQEARENAELAPCGQNSQPIGNC